MSRTDEILAEIAAALDADDTPRASELLHELAGLIGWEQAANFHEQLIREWLERQRRKKGQK